MAVVHAVDDGLALMVGIHEDEQLFTLVARAHDVDFGNLLAQVAHCLVPVKHRR